MNLTYSKTIIKPPESIGYPTDRILAVDWSPDNVKLAVVKRDRTVYIYDESGEVRDKFPTKSGDKTPSAKGDSYIVTGIAFSPDSTKLAIAQSDCMVFVYRVGETFQQKKTITHKLLQPGSVLHIVWPTELEIVCALDDGKIRQIPMYMTKGPKARTVFNPDSRPVALVANSTGSEIASAHVDGRIALFALGTSEGPVLQQVIKQNVPPFGLAIGQDCLIASGCDRKITVYAKNGRVRQVFDYSRDVKETDYNVAIASPTGHASVFGGFERLRGLQFNTKKKVWDEAVLKDVPNACSFIVGAWKRDGTQVVFGTSSGGLFLFDSVLRRSKNKQFEVTYVAPSNITIKLTDPAGTTAKIKSKYGSEIVDVRVMGNNRYAIAQTMETLLICDISRNLVSEIPWSEADERERFYFDNPHVCMIFHEGEMILVEYGKNEILGTFRTEVVNPHVISVRINERQVKNSNINRNVSNKKLAYLLDLKTITIVDLEYNLHLGHVSNESKVDWLELNETGTNLLFRDRRMRLFLVDVDTLSKHTLLNMCSFVQWVPGSDVVVAQSKDIVRVWYNIDIPEQSVEIETKGVATEVVKENMRTLILVREGNSTHEIPLDENRIEFTTAIDDGDYPRAMAFLETCEPGNEKMSMWKNLAKMALESRQFLVAERAYCAVGDIAKGKLLRDTRLLAESVEDSRIVEPGCGIDYYQVQARLSILDGQLKVAEGIFLDHNDIDSAIQMYETLHKWEDAITLAQVKHHPDLPELTDKYLNYLVTSGQHEAAGEFLEKKDNDLAALHLYIEGGLPTKAAKLVSKHQLTIDKDMVKKISTALLQGDFLEEAGEFFEAVGHKAKALECYRKAKAYDKAVKLSKSAFPNEVVALEDEWGDFLCSNRQLDAATNHYIEAGRLNKALDAAIESRQWKKASQIIEAIVDIDSVSLQYVKLGDYFSSVGDLRQAERCYIRGKEPAKSMDMYSEKNMWEDAHRVATMSNISKADLQSKYLQQAKGLQEQSKFVQAEKLYIAIGEFDTAIGMYGKQKMYDDMLRLLTIYHPEHLNDTHRHVAELLKEDDNFKGAETHYLKCGQYEEALTMYQSKGLWEDAYRVARTHGGSNAAKLVVFQWARSLGGETAVRLLNKFGYLNECIDYMCQLCQERAFSFAEKLAKAGAKEKLQMVHLHWGRFLENKESHSEARDHYLEANNAREAVDMYIRANLLGNAIEVAESHAKDELQRVLLLQAKVYFDQEKYQNFESVLLRAERPDVGVKMYKRRNMWTEAFRLCKEYAPHLVQSLQADYDSRVNSEGVSRDPEVIIHQAKEFERLGEYRRAIECYLQLNFNNMENKITLGRCWQRAGELAVKMLHKDERDAVIQAVCPLLISVNLYSQAAMFYSHGGFSQLTIDSLITGDLWADAKKAAREMGPKMEEYVKRRHTEFLKSAGHVDELEDVNVTAALDLLCEQGQWDQCLQKARKHEGTLSSYLAKYITYLLGKRLPVDALEVYSKYGSPSVKQHFHLYKGIAALLFQDPNVDTYDNWSRLRNVFYEVLTMMGRSRQEMSTKTYKEFDYLLLISHFYANRSAFRNVSGLEVICTKISVALLRYTNAIPPDRAFFEAGVACRKVDWLNMAFVFLNHYLDIHDAIDEGRSSTSGLDNTELVGTDIPVDCALTNQSTISTSGHNEVKEWVLGASMDRTIQQELRTDDRGTYEASLLSGAGGNVEDVCLISGYPVWGPRVQFPVKSRAANKEDWNKFVMIAKSGQFPNVTDVLTFMKTWNGGSSQYSLY